MNELKSAYETLGLSENASREEVEQVFEIELRKSRSKQYQSTFDQKLKAYKFITSYDNQQKIQTKSRERYEKWGKFAGSAEKINDFFRIHKSGVIIGAIICIILIAGLTTYMNHREEQQRLASLPPIDLSIMFLGEFMNTPGLESDEALADAMVELFPEWNRFDSIVSYIPPTQENMSPGEIAYKQKAIALLSTEEPDIYILDKSTFEWIGYGGILQNLDSDYEHELRTLITDANDIKRIQTEEDTESHIYGIDVSDTKLANLIPINKQDMILAVRVGSTNKEKSIQFIKKFLES